MRRLAFLAITAFFVTMNVLLWRSEFRPQGEGTPVPLAVVWEKILRAPDDSDLEIFHQKKKIGHLRWAANAGETATTNTAPADDGLQEGMVRKVGGYTIDILDGRLDLGEARRRVRFTMNTTFSTNHQWQMFGVQLLQRPLSLDLAASATNETVTVSFRDGDESTSRTFTFAQLRDPKALLQAVAGPVPLGLLTGGLLGGLGEGGASLELAALPALQKLSLGLQWDSRQDWLKVGSAKLRCYRLQTRLLEKHQAVVYVSRVGEILRVELPDGYVLQNTRMLLL
ncbi:MAG: Uncharacterized protein FD140_4701 [Limisphaerales bacterium]|nr:MAG: Uncharacterized protein FD140_4701 [Limisphaerales bacterium]